MEEAVEVVIAPKPCRVLEDREEGVMGVIPAQRGIREQRIQVVVGVGATMRIRRVEQAGQA